MKTLHPLLLLSALVILLHGCKSKSTNEQATDTGYKLNAELVYPAPYDEGFPLTDEAIDEQAAYKYKDYLEYYKDYYPDTVKAPPFNYKVDINNKTFNELRTLRAEILARHGFLFMDYTMRSHFNAQKWYQPVFWYPDYKIKLTTEEKAFYNKVLKRELELYKQNYTNANGVQHANLNNVINWPQFTGVSEKMMQHLRTDGFVITPGKYEQLFHVYDENYYDYTPNFITTDLYAQVLHMHVSKEMQLLEEDKMFPLVNTLVTGQYNYFKQLSNKADNPLLKKAAGRNQVYYAVALSLLSGKKQSVPGEWQNAFDYEYTHSQKGEGMTSEFLGDSLMDYTQFQPRGNYTRNDTLKRYFQCVKWLNSAKVYLDEEERLAAGILLGKGLLEDEASLKSYETFSGFIAFLAGEENNLSLMHLLGILKNNNADAPALLEPARMEKIRTALIAANPQRMKPAGWNDVTKEFIDRPKMFFTAGRYTFDGEILQRLVNIEREKITDEPKRPFPKGLDVFAVMGNATAEDILLKVYKEDSRWPQYTDTLTMLKKKLGNYNRWDESLYDKTMQTALSLQTKETNPPHFMQTPNWAKKDLNTMLSVWTGLKHDMVLYIEQPSGAEMGDGGEVPPPQKVSYVEPKLIYWQRCIELLERNEKMLTKLDLLTPELQSRNNELKEIAELLLRVSQQELKGERVSNKDFDDLSWLGGQIERLTLRILESPEAMTSMVNTPDRYMAITTDVYTYNDRCLQEAVGMGHVIYAVVEINGLLYLSRGAVFSQYEFTQPTANRLTDEQWQQQLLNGKTPEPAVWMKDIMIDGPAPTTSPNYNLY